jgi:2-iminobutanoate/2-iminopropanoate deaminase
MQRIVTNPEGVAPPAGNYSHSVRVETPGATWVYIAGQVSVDPSGEFVGEGDIRRQTEQVFENLSAVLQANGASFADVVEMRTFVTDVGRLAEVRAVRDGYLPSPPPASTLVEVSGLYRPEAMIEVDAIAVVAP